MGIITHYPPELSSDIAANEPVLFLAGPIQGAPDWQAKAITTVSRSLERCESAGVLHISNPRRDYIDEQFSYPEQVRWEKHNILRAAKFGAVMFWFAKQDPSVEYEAGRAYAQTSRVEFGRVCGWKDYALNLNLVLGIEPGYNGSERYFKTCADEYDIPVYTDLDSTINASLKLIFER